uniref:Amidohydrolase-related domain-containing protein n=1 Tax=Parascaris equorum TaxID=6256 RepID=A0A914S5Z0_PAREQ
FIDTHVHTRDPGHEHKETWETVTRAALAGGITMILAMPNTNPPLTDAKTFDFIEKIASSEAFVDYALFAAGTAGNSNDVVALAPRCAALKLYLDETFGRMTIVSIDDWKKASLICHCN